MVQLLLLVLLLLPEWEVTVVVKARNKDNKRSGLSSNEIRMAPVKATDAEEVERDEGATAHGGSFEVVVVVHHHELRCRSLSRR